MTGDDGLVAIEEFGHLVEAEPDGFLFEAHVEPDGSIARLIVNQFSVATFRTGHYAWVSSASSPATSAVASPVSASASSSSNGSGSSTSCGARAAASSTSPLPVTTSAIR